MTRRKTLLAYALVAVTLVAGCTVARADPGLQTFLDQTLTTARDDYRLPAVVALIQIDGRIVAESAVGVRSLGCPEGVTTADRWHIGSDTKAFTATLIARLVQHGVMHFEDTPAASFPAFANDVNPAYGRVTITHLLSHTAGLPPLTDDRDLPQFLAVIASAKGVRAQRAAVARHFLTMPPATEVGEFAYSNAGYIVAGAVAEAHTGKAWENLIREQVFAPLGITHAGFGAPGTSGACDQPHGHQEIEGHLTPLDPADPDSDNPPALGPAGTINISLEDWALFAQDQLDGVHGHGKLLPAESYRKLHAPVVGNYALGWGVKLDADGTPVILTHSGSNGYWLADVRIWPKHNIIVLLAMNAGNAAAEEASGSIRKALSDRLKPFE